MKLSWVITVCDEIEEFQRLLKQICVEAYAEDEIVVLQDRSKGEYFVERVEGIVDSCRIQFSNITHHVGEFTGNFADWRNSANSLCKGDFIIQLDADEQIQPKLREFLELSTSKIPSLQLIAFPRENRVSGMTPEKLKEFRWFEKPEGINWPDYQFRFYKNCPEIKWKGKVHEKPSGCGKCFLAPPEVKLVHIKSLEKQQKQCDYYTKLKRDGN